ncbi:hypothetical protein B0O80DRAFT_526531 [Mortierella sp. GBAus27b]|nr:hypothetical protein B0O80DRAFT_526531 [Mortierella sp. GBAus27b]
MPTDSVNQVGDTCESDPVTKPQGPCHHSSPLKSQGLDASQSQDQDHGDPSPSSKDVDDVKSRADALEARERELNDKMSWFKQSLGAVGMRSTQGLYWTFFSPDMVASCVDKESYTPAPNGLEGIISPGPWHGSARQVERFFKGEGAYETKWPTSRNEPGPAHIQPPQDPRQRPRPQTQKAPPSPSSRCPSSAFQGPPRQDDRRYLPYGPRPRPPPLHHHQASEEPSRGPHPENRTHPPHQPSSYSSTCIPRPHHRHIGPVRTSPRRDGHPGRLHGSGPCPPTSVPHNIAEPRRNDRRYLPHGPRPYPPPPALPSHHHNNIEEPLRGSPRRHDRLRPPYRPRPSPPPISHHQPSEKSSQELPLGDRMYPPHGPELHPPTAVPLHYHHNTESSRGSRLDDRHRHPYERRPRPPPNQDHHPDDPSQEPPHDRLRLYPSHESEPHRQYYQPNNAPQEPLSVNVYPSCESVPRFQSHPSDKSQRVSPPDYCVPPSRDEPPQESLPDHHDNASESRSHPSYRPPDELLRESLPDHPSHESRSHLHYHPSNELPRESRVSPSCDSRCRPPPQSHPSEGLARESLPDHHAYSSRESRLHPQYQLHNELPQESFPDDRVYPSHEPRFQHSQSQHQRAAWRGNYLDRKSPSRPASTPGTSPNTRTRTDMSKRCFDAEDANQGQNQSHDQDQRAAKRRRQETSNRTMTARPPPPHATERRQSVSRKRRERSRETRCASDIPSSHRSTTTTRTTTTIMTTSTTIDATEEQDEVLEEGIVSPSNFISQP